MKPEDSLSMETLLVLSFAQSTISALAPNRVGFFKGEVEAGASQSPSPAIESRELQCGRSIKLGRNAYSPRISFCTLLVLESDILLNYNRLELDLTKLSYLWECE
jgi:hypothetical protein